MLPTAPWMGRLSTTPPEALATPSSIRLWMGSTVSPAMGAATAPPRLGPMLGIPLRISTTQRDGSSSIDASGGSATFQTYDQDGNRISHDDAAIGVPSETEVASESACA